MNQATNLFPLTCIIIPVYNEASNLTHLIPLLDKYYPNIHMLIIDDGSPDGSADIVKRYVQFNSSSNIELLQRNLKLGLGSAYLAAYEKLRSRPFKYIIQMDADFSHDPKEIENFFSIVQSNDFDLVIGSRYLNGVRVLNWPLKRLILSRLAGVYTRVLTGMPLTDPTSGFIMFKKFWLEKIDWPLIKSNGYFYQIEFKYLFFRKKANMVEIPIIFQDRTKGVSKISSEIIFEAIWGVIKLAFKRFTSL
jgi:dolichol-phosphate mannosyltransferase